MNNWLRPKTLNENSREKKIKFIQWLSRSYKFSYSRLWHLIKFAAQNRRSRSLEGKNSGVAIEQSLRRFHIKSVPGLIVQTAGFTDPNVSRWTVLIVDCITSDLFLVWAVVTINDTVTSTICEEILTSRWAWVRWKSWAKIIVHNLELSILVDIVIFCFFRILTLLVPYRTVPESNLQKTYGWLLAIVQDSHSNP